LKAEGAETIDGLIALINARGPGWWKPITRIGEGKAAAIQAWLQKHRGIAGLLKPSAFHSDLALRTDVMVLDPDAPILLPFERTALPERLSGADGINRNTHRYLIFARNDLQAIDAYLYKCRAQPKTFRAYQKELERFLLWCVLKRRIALSGVMFEACEAHKNFLDGPDAHWIGPRTLRLSENWRPFAGVPWPASQRYAVQAIRSFSGGSSMSVIFQETRGLRWRTRGSNNRLRRCKSTRRSPKPCGETSRNRMTSSIDCARPRTTFCVNVIGCAVGRPGSLYPHSIACCAPSCSCSAIAGCAAKKPPWRHAASSNPFWPHPAYGNSKYLVSVTSGVRCFFRNGRSWRCALTGRIARWISISGWPRSPGFAHRHPSDGVLAEEAHASEWPALGCGIHAGRFRSAHLGIPAPDC